MQILKSGIKAGIRKLRWPADFDGEGYPRASRKAKGRAAKLQKGEIWFYSVVRGIYEPHGDEGASKYNKKMIKRHMRCFTTALPTDPTGKYFPEGTVLWMAVLYEETSGWSVEVPIARRPSRYTRPSESGNKKNHIPVALPNKYIAIPSRAWS